MNVTKILATKVSGKFSICDMFKHAKSVGWAPHIRVRPRSGGGTIVLLTYGERKTR